MSKLSFLIILTCTFLFSACSNELSTSTNLDAKTQTPTEITDQPATEDPESLMESGANIQMDAALKASPLSTDANPNTLSTELDATVIVEEDFR